MVRRFVLIETDRCSLTKRQRVPHLKLVASLRVPCFLPSFFAHTRMLRTTHWTTCEADELVRPACSIYVVLPAWWPEWVSTDLLPEVWSVVRDHALLMSVVCVPSQCKSAGDSAFKIIASLLREYEAERMTWPGIKRRQSASYATRDECSGQPAIDL